MKKLNPQQKAFAEAYVTNGCNAYQAALDAGYSESTAIVSSGEMTRHPVIKETIDRALAQLNEEVAERLGITVIHKAELLSRMMYDIMPKDPSQPPLRAHYKDLIKAMTELNKMQGHYMPDRKVSLTLKATQESLAEAKRVYEDY